MTYLLPGHIGWCIPSFLNYLDNLDKTGKTKFTTEIADQQKGLEYPDLRVKCIEGKLPVDVFAKPSNSFTYLMYLAM